MRRLVVVVFVLMWTGVAEARGKLWMVIDQASESSLHCSSMLDDFWACVLNTTDFDATIAGYTGSTLRPVQPLDFGGMVVASAAQCGNPDTAGWNALLQCVVDAAKLNAVADGDFILYHPPPGGWDSRNCTLCNVTSGGKNVSIRGAFVQSGKCDGYTFGAIHEAFEADTWGGSDDCCNGYYASGVSEDSSCVSMYGATGGELTVTCGYRGYQMQRITHGPRSNGTFYGQDCFPISVTAAAGSPASVCELPQAQRTAGKCIAGNVVTCALSPTSTTCSDGCSEDTTGAHCDTFAAQCAVTAEPPACSGAAVNVSVSCKNTGTATFDNLTLSTSQGSKVATMSPAVVGPGGVGTFTFTFQAPVVTAATSVVQHYALSHPSSPDVALSLTTSPCDSDAGTPVPPTDGGCACRASGIRSNGSGVLSLLLSGLLVRRARRRSAPV